MVCDNHQSPDLKVNLKQLGAQLMKEHQVLQEDYQFTQAAFLTMLGMGLQKYFDDEARDAWNGFCKYVTESLISTNYEEPD